MIDVVTFCLLEHSHLYTPPHCLPANCRVLSAGSTSAVACKSQDRSAVHTWLEHSHLYTPPHCLPANCRVLSAGSTSEVACKSQDRSAAHNRLELSQVSKGGGHVSTYTPC